jgi:hypothetical protein
MKFIHCQDLFAKLEMKLLEKENEMKMPFIRFGSSQKTKKPTCCLMRCANTKKPYLKLAASLSQSVCGAPTLKNHT